MQKNSTANILFVAFVLCIACSVIVSTAAVLLRPMQTTNKVMDQKVNILQVAGLWRQDQTIEQMFANIETRVIDIDNGEYTQAIAQQDFDQRQAAKDAQLSIELTKEQDVANINRRENYAKVYLVKDQDQVVRYVFPVHGYGLWSTLYGYVTLESDLNTIYAIKFYDHKETPGLGGEVDNPKWQALWKGKKIFDPLGEVAFQVKKGTVQTNDSEAQYQVDGLSGATLTSNGVTNMFHFWMGKNGYRKFIQNLNHSEDV